MGQEFVVWAYRDSLDGNQLLEEFRSIGNSDFSGIPKVPRSIKRFVEELDQRWPQLAHLSPGSMDHSPWSGDHWVSDAHAWLHTVLSHNTLGAAIADAIELASANRLVLFDPQLCVGYCPNGTKLKVPLPEKTGRVRVIGGNSEAASELHQGLADIFDNPPPKLKHLLNLHRQATLMGRGELSPDEAQQFLEAFNETTKDRGEPGSEP